MSGSDVAIVNRALDAIRARATVTSINPSDGTLPADVASRHYQDVVDGVLRGAHWNCARFQTSQLTLLKARQGTPANPAGTLAQPPTPWLYEYLMPVSPLCLKPRFLLPGSSQPGVTVPLTTAPSMIYPDGFGSRPVPFIVASDVIDASGNLGKVILTNAPNPDIVYTARIDVPLWDANLTNGIVHTLATWLCQPVTGSNTLMAGLVGLAKEAVGSARISDGNESWQQTQHIPDWLRIRGRQAGFTGAIDAGSCYAGWDSVTFADGSMF